MEIALEQKLAIIKDLLTKRDAITAELYALLGGAPVSLDKPIETVAEKKPRKPRSPNLLAKMNPQVVRSMLCENYKDGVSPGELQRKYKISNSYFYRVKEEFKRDNPELVTTWIKDGSRSTSISPESFGEQRLQVGTCKYCQGKAPFSHTVCADCHSRTQRAAYEERVIADAEMSPEDVKKMVVLDVVDRVPVNEICARFKINMRTYAVLTKKWRDENPGELERWKEVDGKPRSWGGGTFIKK